MDDLGAKMRSARRVLGLDDRRRVLGLSFILAVAVIWVVASFVVQDIESAGAHPAVLTFVANSLFAVYLPIYWVNLKLKRRAANAAGDGHQELRSLFPAAAPRSDAHPAAAFAPAVLPPVEPMSPQQLFRAALIVAPLWFMAQLTFNASLRLTSVTSNTILSSASALFTFLFSMALLAERFTLRKLACIVLLMAGTAMVTVADAGGGASSASGSEHSVAGDMLCLLSAVVYGGYTVALRRLLGEDEGVAMTLFFGFMGGAIFCVVGPTLCVLRLLGVGLGTLSWRGFGLMVAKGLLDNVLSDYLWARAILLVGPTLATCGLSMQVPIAVALDPFLGSPAWLRSAGAAVLTFVGGGVVLTGFFGMTAGAAAELQEQQADPQMPPQPGRQRERWARQAAALEAELEDDDALPSGSPAADVQGHHGVLRLSP